MTEARQALPAGLNTWTGSVQAGCQSNLFRCNATGNKSSGSGGN